MFDMRDVVCVARIEKVRQGVDIWQRGRRQGQA